MPKSLTETKFMDFKGLERYSNQPDRSSNLLLATNVVTNEKPGSLKLREGYELRYLAPTDDTLLRLTNREYVSFENFYEKTAGVGTEVTVMVEKATVSAPTISGSPITSYNLNSIMLWIRPYWNGSYWQDSWQWLNECWITKITVAADATYKNKFVFSGYFGNLATMTIVNVTKDSTNPYAILKTAENGSDTSVWIDTWDPDWDVDDEIVIMRNYIPIKYLLANYNVLRKEISFHRILSKLRIGFGGRQNRVGLAIEYVNRTLQLSDYIFSSVDPEILSTENIFATINKVIVEPYILFGESAISGGSPDFAMQIDTAAGNFPVGTYYFRQTGVINGTDEVLLGESSINITSIQKFLIKPLIKVGSLSRRLTAIKTYLSENGDDYYLVDEFVVNLGGNNIDAQNWEITDDGYLSFIVVVSSTDLNTESNATSAADTNSVGSWTSAQETTGQPMDVAAQANYALRITNNNLSASSIDFIYPLASLAKVPNVGKIYSCTLNQKSSSGAATSELLILGNIRGSWDYRSLKIVGLTNAFVTYSFDVTIPDVFDDISACFLKIRCAKSVGNWTTADTVEIEEFTFTENDTQFFDSGDELGSSMLTELGYQPTFNLVRDWMDAIVLNGITWLAGCWIEKRYDNKIFGSQISGLTANMHDVIPAQKFLDVDRYKGEVIVGIAVLSNNNLAAVKDGSVIILDPDTGQVYEAAVGYGGVIKNSILVIRGTIFWGSKNDIMSMSASSGYLAEQITDKYVRDVYQQIKDKTTQSAVLDKYGAYRIALTDDKVGATITAGQFVIDTEYEIVTVGTTDFTLIGAKLNLPGLKFRATGIGVGNGTAQTVITTPELLLTDRGWLNQERYHHPEVYRNGLGGRVWFMNSGNIYAFPFDEEAFIGYADVYGNYNSGW